MKNLILFLTVVMTVAIIIGFISSLSNDTITCCVCLVILLFAFIIRCILIGIINIKERIYNKTNNKTYI